MLNQIYFNSWSSQPCSALLYETKIKQQLCSQISFQCICACVCVCLGVGRTLWLWRKNHSTRTHSSFPVYSEPADPTASTQGKPKQDDFTRILRSQRRRSSLPTRQMYALWMWAKAYRLRKKRIKKSNGPACTGSWFMSRGNSAGSE